MDREASWDKYTVYFNSGDRCQFEGGSGDARDNHEERNRLASAPALQASVAAG